MNNWLLVLGIALIFSSMFVIYFEHLYNHIIWNIPFSKIDKSAVFHLDNHIVNYTGRGGITATVSHIERIDADTLRLNFTDADFFIGGNGEITYQIPNKFEFTATVDEHDTFIGWCSDSRNDGIFYAQIFRIYEMYDDYVLANHYSAPMPPDLPCKYPDIIQRSIDFDFIVPALTSNYGVK